MKPARCDERSQCPSTSSPSFSFTPETVFTGSPPRSRAILAKAGFALGLAAFFALLFLSLTQIGSSPWYAYYHVGFRPDLNAALVPIGMTAVLALGFIFARFSFGYFAGFYLFVVAAGYSWINTFSTLNYPHEEALLSAAASIILFLIPALTIKTDRLPQISILPRRTPEIILALSIAVLIACASYGAQFVSLDDIYKYRSTIVRPRWLEYLAGNVCGALIPFAVAWSVLERRWFLVAGLCVVSMMFYPVALTKTALFAAPFLLFIAVMSRYFAARWVVLLSLLLPAMVGELEMTLAVLSRGEIHFGYYPFSLLNIRLLAIPSISLEHYLEFFSNHPLTHFCQISVLKSVMSCPYTAQLGVVLSDAYQIGNMNASLLATEGVASVGITLAPIAALVCGLIVACGNVCSARLPDRFILISGSIAAVTLLNVPLSTTLLTNGLGLLMFLWMLTPRAIHKLC